jgi:quercetin dioxygenase-like cupin family protein
MIFKSHDAKKREIRGFAYDVVAAGERSMLIRVPCKAGLHVPRHTHPHEQIGYVVAGKIRLTTDTVSGTLEAGDSYCIPGNEPHSLDAIEDALVLDYFTPLREDYL